METEKESNPYIKLSDFTRPYGSGAIVYRVAWGFVQATLFRWSPRPFWSLRAFLLRLFGARIGKGVRLDPSCKVSYPRQLTIGDNCWIGPNNELYNVAPIELGNNVALAQHVKLYTASHDISDPCFATVSAPILIEDCSWLAACSFVGPGVTVRQGAVLGACSNAFEDLDPWSVYVGSPARKIKNRVLKDLNSL